MDELARETNTSPEAIVPNVPEDVPTPPLKAAIRRARVEEADRSDVLVELRSAEIARLEMLLDAIAPVLDEVPADADLFDAGLMLSAHPRLFIDMIGFVEMGRDRRLYRFVQDTRHERVTLAESEKIDEMVRAITDYIARRLVERDKALASDMSGAPVSIARNPAISATPLRKTRKPRGGFYDILNFTIELLGSMLLFVLVAAGCYYFLNLFVSWSAVLKTIH